jgi:hypothetical protein
MKAFLLLLFVYAIGLIIKFKYDACVGWNIWDRFIDPIPWIKFTVDSFLSNMPILIFVGIFLNIGDAARIARLIRSTLLLIFGGDEKAIFMELSDEYKQRIVKGSLENTLGKVYGDPLYSEIVSSYMKQEQHYRRDFMYRIVCHDVPSAGLQSNYAALGAIIQTLADHNLWIEQDLSYRRCGFKTNTNIEALYLKIALNQEQLNSLMADLSPDIFFREVLRVSDDIRLNIEQLREFELKELVRTVFKLRAFASESGASLDYNVQWAEDKNGKYIDIVISNINWPLEGSGCRLTFTLPQDKADQQFLVFLPRPISEGATIFFKRSESMRSVTKVPFLSEFKHGAYEVTHKGDAANPESIEIKTSSWLFPTSGVMFTWK